MMEVQEPWLNYLPNGESIMILEEVIAGTVSGLAYALTSAILIIFLSMIFKYLTNETFPWLVSIIIGLGIVGIGDGLLGIVKEPTPLSVTRIIVASLILVWATHEGDKLATLLPKKKIHVTSPLKFTGRQNYVALKVPDERDISDIPGRPRVSAVLKKELSGKEFLLPSGLHTEELVKMVRRRIISDWDLGDVELELDEHDRFAYFAISAREEGLSGDLREGFVALPLKYGEAPGGLVSGDIVAVHSGEDCLIDSAEVKEVNDASKAITLIVSAEDVHRCIGKESSQVVALARPKKILTVKEIMTRNVRVVTPDSSLVDAISLMTQHRIGSVIVARDGKPIGILTDGDALQALGGRSLRRKPSKVEDIMSQPVIETSDDSSVNDALAIMRNRNVKKLAVTSEGRLVGIITSTDIFKATSTMT